MKIKKLLSAFLAVIMVMCMLPMAVFAAEGNVAEVNGVQYADLQAAINAARDGDTVTLLADITYTSTADSIVTIKKNLTLDLDEYTITSTKAGDEAVLRVVAPDANDSIDVTINATTGGIKATAKRMAIYSGLNTVAETNLTINGGNYDAGQVTCVWANNGLLTINGGSYKSSKNEAVLDTFDAAACEFMINGGRFYGFNPACMSVESEKHHDHDNVPVGFTAVKDDEGWFTVTEGCRIAMTVCTNASNTAHNHCYASLKDAQAAAGSCDTIVAPKDGGTAVAKVGDDEYGALSEAIDDVESNGTVTLLKNVTLTTPVIINKSLTFNLGTYTLTSTADVALRIVGDETIDVTITGNSGGGINAADFAIYAGNDENDNAKTNVTINGGTYDAAGTDCICQINGLLTVNAGSFRSSFGRTVLNGKRWYGAEFEINGGTFYGFNPACVSVWTGFDGKDWNNFYHQHDILATNKTVHYAEGWYQVVDSAVPGKTVSTKSLCYPSVDVAIQAIVDMNDVANLGVLTLVADNTLTKTELAISNNFAFIQNDKTLTLPEGYELYDVTLEDGRAAKKVKAVVVTEGSDATATETVYVSSAEDLNNILENEEGKIIVVNADFAVDSNLNWADGSILDLNGHTITLPKNGIEISGKNITVKNGTLGCAVTKGHQYTLYIAEGTTATIEGVTINGAIYTKNGAELTLKDNTIKPWVSGNASAVYADGAKVTVLSGTFNGSTHGIFKEAYGGEITVHSGRFDRKNASYKVSLSNFVAENSELVKAVDGVYKYEVVCK